MSDSTSGVGRAERLVAAARFLLRSEGSRSGALELIQAALALDPHNDVAASLLEAHAQKTDEYPASSTSASTSSTLDPVNSRTSEAPFAESTLREALLADEPVAAGSAPGEAAPDEESLEERLASVVLANPLRWDGEAVASGFVLEFLAGPLKGQREPFSKQRAQVGEAEGCTLASQEESLLLTAGPSTFVSVRGEQRVQHGALIRAGRRTFRVEPLPGSGSGLVLQELNERGQIQRSTAFREPVVTVGAKECTLTFPSDADLAPCHFELTAGPWAAFLADSSEGAGTFLQVPSGEAVALRAGDLVWSEELMWRVTAA